MKKRDRFEYILDIVDEAIEPPCSLEDALTLLEWLAVELDCRIAGIKADLRRVAE